MYPAMASSIKVFSAHAEVVPPPTLTCPARWSILRARGGSSGTNIESGGTNGYSPRTRR